MTPHMASTVHADAPDAITSSVEQRIRGEYTEMPGLTLTVRQAARLWGLEVPQSQRLLAELVNRPLPRRGCERRLPPTRMPSLLLTTIPKSPLAFRLLHEPGATF